MLKVLLWVGGSVTVLALALASVLGGAPLTAAPGTMSATYKSLYLGAAATCPGLPPEILMAIGQIESSHGADPVAISYAGAMGPMQFMPATWVAYGVDANHDGTIDPFDPADAIYSAARLLCADGGGDPTTLLEAVALYNPGDPTYALNVMAVAQGYEKVVPPGTPTLTVTSPLTSTSTPTSTGH